MKKDLKVVYNMGAGRSNLYSATRGGFNSARSKSVRRVNVVNILEDEHKISTSGTPNSVSKLYKKGNLERERYYDEKGRVYLDIDYSEHNNANRHPIVPHEHRWYVSAEGELTREKGREING